MNSRIPVRLERSGVLAIAEGQNEDLISLRFLPQNAQVKIGDRVLTSGHGANFPPDLPVGRVVDVTGNVVLMEPLGNLSRLDFIKVLAYSPVIPEEDTITNPLSGGLR